MQTSRVITTIGRNCLRICCLLSVDFARRVVKETVANAVPILVAELEERRLPLQTILQVFCPCMTPIADSFALVLTGGGGRAGDSVGVLRCLARRLPQGSFDVIT